MPAVQPLGINKDRNPLLADWTYRALTESAILEATLFHSSVHLDQLHQRHWSVTTRYHREAVIREVSRLMKLPGEEASDGAIAAVGMMAGTGVGKAGEDILVPSLTRYFPTERYWRLHRAPDSHESFEENGGN